MGTNPIGKGTKNVTVNMPDDLRASLAALAEKSGMTLSAYIKTILADAAEGEAKVSTRVERGRLPKSGSSGGGSPKK